MRRLFKYLLKAYEDEKKVITMGNAGHASTASHHVNDLTKHTIVCDEKSEVIVKEKRFKALCLNDSIATLTGWANDAGYESCFSEPLAGWVEEGDVVIGISASGNSQNILRAFRVAKDKEAITIALSDYQGGKIKEIAKVRYMLGGQVRVPLVLRTQGGAGKSYGAQHSQSLEGWFAHTPGLKVVMPSAPRDAKGLLKSSIREDNPIMFIEHKLLYNNKGEIPIGDYTIPIGKAEVKRKGNDITIATYSRMVLLALEAALLLEKEGIDVEVIDLRTLSPLDINTVLDSVKKTGHLLTVEEGNKSFGVGAEISARVVEKAFDSLDAPIRRLATKDIPIPFSRNFERAILPDTEQIISEVKKLV